MSPGDQRRSVTSLAVFCGRNCTLTSLSDVRDFFERDRNLHVFGTFRKPHLHANNDEPWLIDFFLLAVNEHILPHPAEAE